jgi:hypothetical protein
LQRRDEWRVCRVIRVGVSHVVPRFLVER